MSQPPRKDSNFIASNPSISLVLSEQSRETLITVRYKISELSMAVHSHPEKANPFHNKPYKMCSAGIYL
jgi:hypothetical protein